MKRTVIAYGHMADLDGKPKIVVHAKCWNAYAGKHPYRLAYSSAFFEGAQNEQLRETICFHCKMPFARLTNSDRC